MFATLYIASLQNLARASLTESSYEVITTDWRIDNPKDFDQALVSALFII